VLEAFERETGVRVRPVYDTEANKSRGLALRLRSEASRPRADVFWSSEVLQMVSLRDAGVLEPYRSRSAEGIPERFRDPDGYWTGFAARFRVLVYNRKRVSRPPGSLLELTDPRWKGEVAMADPLFGATTTEAVALFAELGTERAREYYRARQENRTRIVDGNSVAAEWTARGDTMVGQTDMDDAFIRIDRGADLGVVFPDQDGMGAVLIPNTAALVRGAPHAEQGRKLLDFLLRPETELLLASLPSRQLPLHPSVRDRLPEKVKPLASVRAMAVDYSGLAASYPEVDRTLAGIFHR
jgi:iron(III) transport system substrate-binding protein